MLAAKNLELGERIKSLTLIPSSGGAFEIRANGKLLHSKLDTGDWPDFDAGVTAVRKAKKPRRYSAAGHCALAVRIFQRPTLNAQYSILNSDHWTLDVGR